MDDSRQKIKIEQHSMGFGVWIAAWMFTIGYLQLGILQAIIALILWPYFLGVHFSPLLSLYPSI